MGGKRAILGGLLCLLGLSGISGQLWARSRGPFYRILHLKKPSDPAILKEWEIIYGAKLLFIESDTPPAEPVKVRGIVWHEEMNQAKYFIGEFNPNLEPADQLKLLETKWEEAKLVQGIYPEAYPKTENIRVLFEGIDLRNLSKTQALEKIYETLSQRYPNGFFIKHVESFATDGKFPTDKTNFVEIYRQFQDLYAVHFLTLQRSMNISEAFLKMKNKPGFTSGWTLDLLLKEPDKMIVQERLRLMMGKPNAFLTTEKEVPLEYRVHVVEGKILKDSTVLRWYALTKATPFFQARVEECIATLVSRFPESLKKISFAADIAITEDGRPYIIELNVGGGSGFMHPDSEILTTHLLASHYQGKRTPFLKAYREFESSPTIEGKIKALEKMASMTELMKRHPILEIDFADYDPLFELNLKIKNVLLKALDQRGSPSYQELELVTDALSERGMDKYLTEEQRTRLSEYRERIFTSSPSAPPLFGSCGVRFATFFASLAF